VIWVLIIISTDLATVGASDSALLTLDAHKAGCNLVACISFASCGLFGLRCPLTMPECWSTPSLPVVWTIATLYQAAAVYLRPLQLVLKPKSFCTLHTLFTFFVYKLNVRAI